MGRTRSFKPAVADVLEERVVLSHAPVGVRAAAAAVHHAAATAGPNLRNTPVQLGPVGALGDSYTDEYQFYPPNRSQARNWVEILHAQRLVNFGPFTTASRGEPRDQGYAYNWARSDATSVDMINNQLPGLAQQVAQGKIRYAWIFIGGNDFIHFAEGVATGVIPQSQALAGLVQVSTTVQTNFATAIQTLKAADPNIKIVASTLPDISVTPLARQFGNTPQGKILLDAISQAIASYNQEINAFGADPNIAIVDLAAITKQVSSSPTGYIPFGGTVINLAVPSDEYHHFFLADQLHIGTVAQGIVADAFVKAIDTKFNAQLFPLPETAIVHYAAKVYRHAQHRR